MLVKVGDVRIVLDGHIGEAARIPRRVHAAKYEFPSRFEARI